MLDIELLRVERRPATDNCENDDLLKAVRCAEPIDAFAAEGEAGMQRGCTLIRWLDAAEEKRAKLKRARKFEAVHQCQAPKASD
jgi:hypothetical protein